jgi:hypothetical protein
LFFHLIIYNTIGKLSMGQSVGSYINFTARVVNPPPIVPSLTALQDILAISATVGFDGI